MARKTTVVTWNGKDVPLEFLDHPAGRYSVEPVEDEASALSLDDEAGFRLLVHKTG